jgi:hypothetical protein
VSERSFATFQPATLMSRAYVDLQRQLHAAPRGYGGKGDKWATGVRDLVAQFGATSVLDYGCGQGTLVKALRPLVSSFVRLSEYDPAIDGKHALPVFADLVTCCDVLEHVEPEYLDVTLQHLAMLARKAIFVVVATRPSNKTLADGRNAHLIIEDAAWWRTTFVRMGFTVADGPTSPLAKPSRELVAVLTEAA